MSYYFLTDDDGGTLWQSLGPDDPDPKPLISRRGSTTALWQLALRGAGLDGETVCVDREDLSTLVCMPLLVILPEYAHDAVERLTEALNEENRGATR